MTDVEHAPPSRRLPSEAGGYELVEQIGSSSGTSGVVYRAMCQEIDDEVAVRIIDLDQLQASLEDISKDIKVMSLSSHPNVLPFSTCFVAGNDLWVVMPLLTGGSVTSLISCIYHDGMPPSTAIYVLHSALKALDYFHSNGQIHRDVRAANILLDAKGQVMLSDYGMMGWMVEGGWERKQRQTFVGTPCWMAPEVMEQTSGYDYKADIWSLGITAIELATGAAPYANYPAMKVLVLTLQNPPPTVGGRAADSVPEAFHDFVAVCLEKDPELRPTARQLLAHPLFESVEIPSDLPDVLASLPPVGSRAGAAQKMLYRQMQKAIAPSGSGIWNKPADRRGWDFGDDSITDTVNDRSCDGPSSVATGQPLIDGKDGASAATGSSGIAASQTASAGSEQVIVVPNTAARGSPLGANYVPTASGVSLRDAANPDGLMRQSEISAVTPGNTPFVTPANLTAIPAVSPDGDPRMSLPPSASGADSGSSGVLVGHSLSGTSIANQQPGGASLTVPGLPNKSGVLQKKGRFTVTDVDVSADKLNAKLNNFIDDDLDMSASGSQHASNGLGGAISSSSSFTSLQGGPSSENSPTSAVQNAVPVVGRAVLPVGMEQNASQSLTTPSASAPPLPSVPPPVHMQAASAFPSRETRKGRFEVTPVELGKSQGNVTTQPSKPRSRFETKDLPEGAHASTTPVPADSTGFNSNHSRSPNLGPSSDAARLPSAKSRDALPTNPPRPSAPQSSHVATHFVAPVLASATSPSPAGSSALVQNLTQCIAALGHEYESLRLENDALRRDVERARATADPEASALKQQLAQQQSIAASQHSLHEKAIQQLQHRLQHLQRQHETLMSHLFGRQQDGIQQQQPQVVKLVQGQRSQGQPHQSTKPQSGTLSPSSHVAPPLISGSTGQIASVGTQSRSQLPSEHQVPASYSHAVSGSQIPPSGLGVQQQSRSQHMRQIQATGSSPLEPRSGQASHQGSQQAASSNHRHIARPALTDPRVPVAANGSVLPSNETMVPVGAGPPSDATSEDSSVTRLLTSENLSQSQSHPQQGTSAESAAMNSLPPVDGDGVLSMPSKSEV